jgi:hypothetical protein
LVDGPPKSALHKFYLFVNHCRVKKLPSGRLVLERKTNVEVVEHSTIRGRDKLLQAFVNRRDVRLLRNDLETNDFEQLPKRQLDVPSKVVRGTAEIYQ